MRGANGQLSVHSPRTPQPRDPKTGAFLPCRDGESGAAETHGLRSRNIPPEYLALQSEFLAGALVDEGGESELTVRRNSQLQYRALLHRQILMIDAALRSEGIFDRRQRLRVAWLQRLEGFVALALRVDVALGWRRRTKQIPSAREWVRESEREREREEEPCERG